MQRLQSFDPSSMSAVFTTNEEPGDYGVVVPLDLFLDLRNTQVTSVLARRLMQDRPFYYFNGAAEHLLLSPLSTVINHYNMAPDTVDTFKFFIDLARNMSTVARGAASFKSRIGVQSFANLIVSMTPQLSLAGQYSFLGIDSLQGGNNPTPPQASIGSYLYELMTSSKVRENIEKTLMTPGAKVDYGRVPTSDISADTINTLLSNVLAFGTGGKQNPLLADQVDSVIAMRFTLESFLSSIPKTRAGADSVFASALWYIMYSNIARTPESYDAAFPVLDLTANDSLTASGAISRFGSLAKTAFACASAPSAFTAYLNIRQLEDTLEFLAPFTSSAPDIVRKITERISVAKDLLSDTAYPPLSSFSNVCYDYVKKLTGARYLLPEYLTDLQLPQGIGKKGVNTPFSTMPNPMTIDVPKGYRGFLPNVQRVDEFGGLDIPFILQFLESKSRGISNYCSSVKHSFDSILGTLPSPTGDYVHIISDLSNLQDDPALGEISYPELTRVYITPTYYPKFVQKSNGTIDWSLADYPYNSIFPTGLQMKRSVEAEQTPSFTWDTEVKLEAAPSTGLDFSFLPIPFNYTMDCNPSHIDNSMAQVKQFLATSPHRPMNQLTDYFIPFYQGLGSGLTKSEVLANAFSAIGLLYKRKRKGTGKWNDPNSWEWIKPQVPFVYGYPIKDLEEVNAPWKDAKSSNHTVPSDMKYVDVSPDGNFMTVLYRMIPTPMELAYVPYVLYGGFSIALPVARAPYAAALNHALSNKADIPAFLAKFRSKLLEQTMSNNLVPVSGWSRCISPFPHLFVANRDVPHAFQSPIESLPQLACRRKLAHDAASPFGALLSYYRYFPEVMDVSDLIIALGDPNITDISSELKSKSHKASTGTGAPEKVHVAHQSPEVINDIKPDAKEPLLQSNDKMQTAQQEVTLPDGTGLGLKSTPEGTVPEEGKND